MKTTLQLIALSFMLTIVYPLMAQNKANNGGFGYFRGGVGMPLGNQVQNRLKEANMFGNQFKLSTPGVHLGGQGFGIINRFIIGGGGYSTTITGSNDLGETTYSIGAGFFNFGYLLIKKESTNLFAFAGIGGGGGNLKIKNTGSLTMALATNQQIPVNENRKINSGGFGFEFGVGYNRVLINKTEQNIKGGFMLGLVAGINYFPTQEWKFEANETKVSNMGNLSSVYIGITIGGGGSSNE